MKCWSLVLSTFPQARTGQFSKGNSSFKLNVYFIHTVPQYHCKGQIIKLDLTSAFKEM